MNDNEKNSICFVHTLGYDEQHLHHEAIYSLNRKLFEIIDSLAETSRNDQKALLPNRNYWVTPVLFNKNVRTWHNACVLEAWDVGDTENVLLGGGVVKDLLTLQLKIALSRLQSEELPGQKWVTIFHRTTNHAFEADNSRVDYHAAFKRLGHNLLPDEHVQEAYTQARGYIERSTERLTKLSPEVISIASVLEMIAGCSDLKIGESYDGEKCRDFIRTWMLIYHSFKMHRHIWVPGILLREARKWQTKGINWLLTKPMPQDIRYQEAAFNIGDKQEYTETELYDQDLSVNEQRSEIVSFDDMLEKRGAVLLQELSNIFYSERISKEIDRDSVLEKGVVVLPIYDTWIGDFGCGGIWGVLIFFFKTVNDHETFFTSSLLPRYRKSCQQLANELERSAITTLTNRPISPPYDLVDLFIQSIVELQDWEWVSVYREEQHLYCYHRQLSNGQYCDDLIWRKCEPPCEEHCFKRDNTFRTLDWKNEHQEVDIWSKELMPELSDQDMEMYSGIHFSFGYPETIWRPEDTVYGPATQKLFELHLIDQQIRILRTILTKVQARRNALRNAVVSIMGRNMSHNIGSHVLARYAAKREVKEDDVLRFMQYLQERMDFIAEVSTTEIFYKLPVAFYKEAIAGLIGSQGSKYPQTILLENISGLDGVPITISSANKKSEDFVCDSPSGRLGIQALYVLLENIARNTAKHGSLSRRPIFPKVEKAGEGCVKMAFEIDFPIDMYTDVLLASDTAEPDIEFKNIKSVVLNGKKQPPLRQAFGALLKGKKKERGLADGLRRELQEGINIIEIFLKNNQDIKPFSCFSLIAAPTINLNIKVENNVVGREEDDHEHTSEEQLLKVTVWDDLSNCQQHVKRADSGEIEHIWLPDVIQDKLTEPMIMPSGDINPHDWGIREIFLAAAYLRGVSYHELESYEYWPRCVAKTDLKQKFERMVNGTPGSFPILLPVAVDEEGNVVHFQPAEKEHSTQKYTLGYQFYLPKRQLVWEIAEPGNNWLSVNEQEGIYLTIIDPTQSNTRRTILNSYLSGEHKPSFMIMPDKSFSELSVRERNALPILTLTRGEMPRNYDPKKIDQVLSQTWLEKHNRERQIGEVKDWSLYISGDHVQDSLTPDVKPLENTIAVTEDNVQLIFDNHNELYSELHRAGRQKELETLYFYEPFRKANPQYDLLLGQDMENHVDGLKYAALCRVCIIDERIQAMLQERCKYSGMKYSELFHRAGIYAPAKKEVNLDDVANNADSLFGYFDKLIASERCMQFRKVPLDYLVIHQTIIDKLRIAMGKKLCDEDMSAIAKKLGCQYRVIVCSGRGNPRKNLPDYGRFLPISALLEWTINNPSKYHLINLLAHARRPQEN